MGRLDDLIVDVKDTHLRDELRSALADMKRKQRFGLVFEEHIPETTALLGLPVGAESLVQRRDREGNGLCKVQAVLDGGKSARIVPIGGGETEVVPMSNLLVIKRFGDPIYPSLSPLGTVKRGGEKPYHAVINGENYHVLQLLKFSLKDAVDCIYIDPPYNTGARDWKYNNRYVDDADAWKHSKWLSFMEKRLKLSQELLKRDGVLIVTIDEHEVHHLGMLLERLFPKHLRYMVTIIINPKGRTSNENFARIEEYAFFVVPNLGYDVIPERPIGASLDPSILQAEDRDLLESVDERQGVEEEEGVPELDQTPREGREEWEIRNARRRGGGAEQSSYRPFRPNQFYPIYVDEKAKKVVKVGSSISPDAKPDFKKVGDLRPIWPIDKTGTHRVWGFKPESMQEMIDRGDVFLGKYNPKQDYWTINYRVAKKVTRKLMTVWRNKAYDAGTYGSEMLRQILGKPGLFPFPKSVYSVRDCIAAVVRDRPNAIILDFFAGSGTTLHAACLLNAEDGGSRRTVLVTNNEVSEDDARELNNEGYFRGDARFEKEGIFERVTRPRCESIIRGVRPDGSPIPGRHIDNEGKPKGRPFNLGFKENVEFFALRYLDPDEVDLGRQFEAILPSLWLAAGGRGDRNVPKKDVDFLLPETSPYGVLFREAKFHKFKQALLTRDDVNHAWLVTDSEEAYAEMRAELPKSIHTSMLYRDYLRNFQITS